MAISLKVLVDKERKSVVFAESDNKFVDILFSFLTLPMGTVVRLLRDKSQPSTAIGSMSSLYESIENLDISNFKSAECKSMLLRLKNPSQAQCRSLKLNIDDTEPMRYYVCDSSYHCNDDKNCGCGKLRSKEMYLPEDVSKDQTIFAKETATFMITDDLQVIPSSTANSLELFLSHGIKDFNAVEEKTIKLGLPEVLSLLKLSFLSKNPLTKLFLRKNVEIESSSTLMHKQVAQVQSGGKAKTVKNFKEITLKLIVQKSKNKVLYAEAKEDFVNYVLTFPAITLGSMAKLLNKTPSLGCISNLYKTVESLSVDRHLNSQDAKAKLLSPKLGLQVGHRTHIRCLLTTLDNTSSSCHRTLQTLYKNPDTPTLETIGNIEIVKVPATYLVADDLVVTEFSPISTISILSPLKIAMHDLEVREVTFGEQEALKLLEASLTTKSALTTAFSSKVSDVKPKLEK